MPVPQDLADALAAVDTDTTALAAVVDSLRAKISTSMTAADVELVKGKLGAISTRLKATAHDPDEPVPPTPPPTPV